MRIGFSAGSATLTAGSWVVVPVSTSVIDADAEPWPEKPLLDHIEVEFSGLAPSNTTCEAWLSWDAAGDLGASNVDEQDIERGKTTGTVGSAVYAGPAYLPRRAGADTDILYVWLQPNGTGNPVADVRVTFVEGA